MVTERRCQVGDLAVLRPAAAHERVLLQMRVVDPASPTFQYLTSEHVRQSKDFDPIPRKKNSRTNRKILVSVHHI